MKPENFGKRKRNLLFSDASNVRDNYIPEHTADMKYRIDSTENFDGV